MPIGVKSPHRTTVTIAASVVAGLLGPVAIAIYAIMLSLPVWGTWWWLVRRG